MHAKRAENGPSWNPKKDGKTGALFWTPQKREGIPAGKQLPDPGGEQESGLAG